MYNWYIKAQRIDLNSDQLFSRQHADRKGVYLTQNPYMAMAYANGRTRDAHGGALMVRDGVLFEIVLGYDDYHVGGDVWESYKDDLIKNLQIYKKTKSIGNVLERLLEAAGIENFNQNLCNSFLADPDSLLYSIDHRTWSDVQEREMGYSEIVMEEVPWEKIHRVLVYDGDGNVEKEIQGGFYDEKKFEEAKDEGLVYYHGSPRRFWPDL